jgi:SAM-dependent methyltransferase
MTSNICCENAASGLIAVFSEYRMFRCGACGSAFVDPQPSEAVLSEFYDRFHFSDAEGGIYDVAERRMASDFPEKVSCVKGLLRGPAGRLLDVGCGKGYFVRSCVDAGIDAQGLDISRAAIEYATNSLGINAICSDVESVGESLGQFDVITLWATIEHLPGPDQYLRAVSRMLKAGGVIVLDTGLADDWLDRMLPGVNQWYDPPQHLWVFSRKRLEKMGARVGLTAIYVDTQYERTMFRRVVKVVRNGLYATGLRLVSGLSGVIESPQSCPKFPVGSLIRVVYGKPEGGSPCRV